jgi:dimethylaniline monooxygenase (N-oxide forming)
MLFQPPQESIDEHQFFDAEAMADYHEKYVDAHVYDGKSLRDRVMFNTEIIGLEKIDGVWNIHCSKAGKATNEDIILKAPKVIVCTGGTSDPIRPTFANEENFKGQIVHTRDWGRMTIFDDPSIKSVVVLGGAKSAADIVYQSVKAGKQVSWVIRKSGKGPAAFIGGQKIGWFANAADFAFARMAIWIVLAGFATDGWWYAFLFRTRIGQWLYKKMGKMVDDMATKEGNFYDRPGAKESFKNLDSKSRYLQVKCMGRTSLR